MAREVWDVRLSTSPDLCQRRLDLDALAILPLMVRVIPARFTRLCRQPRTPPPTPPPHEKDRQRNMPACRSDGLDVACITTGETSEERSHAGHTRDAPEPRDAAPMPARPVTRVGTLPWPTAGAACMAARTPAPRAAIRTHFSTATTPQRPLRNGARPRRCGGRAAVRSMPRSTR